MLLVASIFALPATASIPIKLKLLAEPSNIVVGEKSTIFISLLDENSELVATEFDIPVNISTNLGNFSSSIIIQKGLNSYSKQFTSEVSGIAIISVNSKGFIGDTTSIAVILPSTGEGASGSAGVTTSEMFENIETAERHEKTLIANKPITYTFTAPEHGVYEIVVIGQENENDIAIRVEALKGTSKLVSVSPPGAVYKNLNVWAGTKQIKDALIRFKVENSWLTSSNIASGNLKMVRWERGRWVQLDTTQMTKDNSITYFEAKTGGFSVFAIVGLKEGEVIPEEGEVVTPTTTPVTEKTPVTEATEKESPGFGVIIAIATFMAMYIFWQKR